jgi:hypothetical protein
MSNTSPNFIQQFELNSNSVAMARQPMLLRPGRSPHSRPTTSPAFIRRAFRQSLVATPSAVTAPIIAADKRGVLNFTLYYNLLITPGVSLITSDNLAETLNFLVSVNKRNVTEIQ